MKKEQEDQYFRGQALIKLTPRLKDDSIILNEIEVRAIKILEIDLNENWKSQLQIIIQEKDNEELLLKHRL